MTDKSGYEFPQYRKLSNGKVFYKIIDWDKFQEKQKMGSKVILYTIEATQYPEMLKIRDMLELTDGIYVDSTKEEWESVE